jgi:large subunit ribosomal protein L22
MVIVSGKYKYARISGKKVSDVIKLFKIKKDGRISSYLDFLLLSNKKASKFLLKLFNSVLANSEHNYNFNINDLFIYRICIGRGPYLKRFRARAKGRSNTIFKNMCHIYLSVYSKV